ncbi:MAG TPA: hypothetical protein PKZ56_01750 [Candidatus Paceibacterota bacterium]|nr:hypothetical protein [Candidatus Paceibacterota bacterium]
MMPSSYKNQQQPAPSVSSNGTVTTTVTTTTAAAPSAKFTQAELGSRSLARSIDRKMQEMSKQQSEVGNNVLDQVLAREKKDIAEDRSFGSTSNVADIPDQIMRIILAHDIFQDQIIRMIHIPGANYFSVSHIVDGVKKYTTFSTDEVIDDPEQEVEISELEQEEEVTPEVIPDEVPDYPATSLPLTSTTNTLGTIGAPQVRIIDPTVSEIPTKDSLQPISQNIQPEIIEPKIIIAPIENPEPPKEVISPTRVSLDEARKSCVKEFPAFYSSNYKERQTGTFNQLFGNNKDVHDTLFKTMNSYEAAKKNYFKEFSNARPSLRLSINEVRTEQLRLADVLSHQKHGVFAKAAHTFTLEIPTVIETRNRIIGTAGKSTLAPITERLGIHGLTKNEPTWKKLFTDDSSKKSQPIISVAPVVALEPIPTTINIESKNLPSIEKKANRKKIYDSLHVMILKAWNINQPKQNKVPAPELIVPAPESVIEPAAQVIQESVSKPVTEGEVLPLVMPTPLSFSPDNKQHPEHLFN